MVEGLVRHRPAEVLCGIFQAWSVRDKAAVVAHFAADAVYCMILPTDVVPYGGETRGRASISDRLQTILDHFDTVEFDGTVTKVAGDEVHGLARYTYRHKITGEAIDAEFRIVAHVRDGLVVDFKEIHDIEKVRAFMRLIAYVAMR